MPPSHKVSPARDVVLKTEPSFDHAEDMFFGIMRMQSPGLHGIEFVRALHIAASGSRQHRAACLRRNYEVENVGPA
jgi:hypothetical protein